MYLLPRFFTEELIMLDTDEGTVAKYLVCKGQKATPPARRRL
jgi:hypothetical protein